MPRTATAKATKSPIDLKRKNRTYHQIGKRSAAFIIQTSHKKGSPLQYIDNGIPRSLRYCTNQTSVFMDEQEGDAMLGRVTMENGTLQVPADNMVLQNFLALTPHNGLYFEEFDPEAKADEEIKREELLFKAKSMVFNSKIETLKQVAIILKSARAKSWTTSEVKQNLLSMCTSEPDIIIDLFSDEDLEDMVIAKEALEHGILHVKGGKLKIENAVICEIPFDAEPYEVLKEYLKTIEGKKLKIVIQKKLK